jgi:hypothetical protein
VRSSDEQIKIRKAFRYAAACYGNSTCSFGKACNKSSNISFGCFRILELAKVKLEVLLRNPSMPINDEYSRKESQARVEAANEGFVDFCMTIERTTPLVNQPTPSACGEGPAGLPPLGLGIEQRHIGCFEFLVARLAR